VKNNLHQNNGAQIEVTEATTDHWDSLITRHPSHSEVVYSVGGGLTADAAKYFHLYFLRSIC
jgi:glycerol dehydrogenase-like iron-containing ADH family enzyme